MTTLPAALSPWEPWLVALPGEVLAGLGPWLPRLRFLLGALSRSGGEGDGEPDGVSGIGRRGSYEQLLLSEWAVAEIAPMEFLRRAAQGEHLFLQPRRRAPAGSPRTVVLFDCGPDLLGAPRLVQAALLIVFARRAADAGATLSWAILQDRNRTLHDVVDAASLRLFVHGRSRRPATPDDLQVLCELAGLVEEPEELWVVGAARAPVADGVRLITVDQPLSEDAVLHVDLPGAGRSPVVLQLPDPPQQAALLRRLATEPVSTVPVGEPGPAADPTAGLIWSQDGRRILTMHGAGDDRVVKAWHVPPNPRSRPGRPRVLPVPAGVPLVGVGFSGRAFHWVTTDGGRGYVHEGFVRRPRAVPLPAVPTPGWFAHDGLRHAIMATPQMHQRDLVLVDAARTLWVVQRSTGGRMEVLATDVLAFQQNTRFELTHVSVAPVSGVVELVQLHASLEIQHREATELGASARAFFGCPGWMSHQRWGLLAVGDGVLWTVYWGSFAGDGEEADNEAMDSLLLDPAEGSVVGVARDPANLNRGVPGLLVLDPARRTLTWRGFGERRKTICTWPRPARSVSASMHRPQVAAVLDDGTVSVRMLEDGVEVLAVEVPW